MIKPINNSNLTVNNNFAHKSLCRKDSSGNLSFKCNALRIIKSDNPANINTLMYISINNLSKKTKNLFSKAFLWFAKMLAIHAVPGGTVKNSGTILAIDGRNLIKGGLVTQKIPHNSTVRCQYLIIDSANQDKKNQLKTFCEIAKSLCKSCKEDRTENIVWRVGDKNKTMVNLSKKFAIPKILGDTRVTEFSTSTERLEEFLCEMQKKHLKILR